MIKRKVIYPGTFDPVTYGHLDVIERGLKLFDEVIVAVAERPNKKTLFSIGERIKLLEKVLKGRKGVKVVKLKGLLVKFAQKEGCGVIIKGLRELSDFQHEFQQAIVNRKLYPDIETVLIVTNPRYFYLNSSIVKEITMLGGSVEKFVPKEVESALKEKIKKKGIKKAKN